MRLLERILLPLLFLSFLLERIEDVPGITANFFDSFSYMVEVEVV